MTPPLALARIHGFVAREAPVAVLLRRGPSDHVCQLLWNLETDEITAGQWLKHRVYPERADLSPDGKHFVYFAASHKPDTITLGAYCAVSRPPFFTALALYPIGHSWSGFCQFNDNRTYWIDTHALGQKQPPAYERASSGLSRTPSRRTKVGLGEGTWERDGWQFVERSHSHDGANGHRTAVTREIWEREVTKGWALERTATYSFKERGPFGEAHWMSHRLIGLNGPQDINAGWADVYKNDVLYADDGRVYRLKPGDVAREIADLNPMRFKGVKAPYEGVQTASNDPTKGGGLIAWHPLNDEEMT